MSKTGYPSIDKPWLRYYPEGVAEDRLPEKTIYEWMYENNKNYPNDIALVYMNKKITYEQLLKNIDIVEKALVFHGVKKGDIVTIAMPSTPEAVYCIYAINKIRAIANIIHPLAGVNEILNYLNEVKSDVFIMFTGTYNIIKDSLSKTSVKRAIVACPTESLGVVVQTLYKKKEKIKLGENVISWKTFVKSGKNIKSIVGENANCHDVSIMSHTGGTTGSPKCVMLTDYNINSVIWQIGCNMPHDRQESMLVCLPPFVNYSLTNCILEPLAFGFKTVLIPDYKADKFADYVKKYRFNHFNSIPPYWEALLHIEEIKTMDLSCLNYLFYGGDAMNPAIEEKVNELLLARGARRKINKGYGATEMTSAVTATFDDCNGKGSIGVPLPKMVCKVVDSDTYEELSYNEEGELCFSGPSIMVGYYQNQEATDEIIKVHKDGIRYIHMGDLGYISPEGIVYITGRIKRLMITKDNNGMATKMFPERIEKVINKHPAVEICCVVGKQDEFRVNIPKAFIVLTAQFTESEKIKQEIMNICRNELPEYMLPEEMEFRKSLPRTPRDKIDYKALQKEEEER